MTSSYRRPRRGSGDHIPSSAAFEEASLVDMLRQGAFFLRRRLRFVVLCALAGAVLAAGATMQMDRRYQSELLLMVQQPAASPIETDPIKKTLLDSYVDGQIYIIESNEVLRRVLDRAGLRDDPDYQRQPPSLVRRAIGTVKGLLGAASQTPQAGNSSADPAEAFALRELQRNLRVNREGNTNVISVRVTASAPAKAARIADAIGEAFILNREDAQFMRATRVSGWLDERAIELQRQLSAAEEAVTAYKIENNLISGAPGTTLSEQQLVELNTELIRTRAALAEKRAAFAQARDLLGTGGDIQSLPQVQGSSIILALRSQLLELKRREAEISALNSDNPRFLAIQEARGALEIQLAQEVQRIVNVISNEVETLEARERLVAEALREAGGQTGAESRSGVELRELERVAAAYQALYERYISNAGIAEESVSYLASGVEIVDHASVPGGPISPPTKVIILFGLLLGAGLGTVYSAIREAVQPGFVTAGQVDRELGQPVLACVPGLQAKATAHDTVLNQPLSAFSEAVRSFRHELAEDLPADWAPVQLITSAGPGEGKTSLATALAASASLAGLNVLLIDADIRRAGLTRSFDLQGEPGLSDILQGGKWDLPVPSEGQDGDFDIVPVGSQVSSPSDLLVSAAMQRYLVAVREAYDLIVIDGPPVANMADAPILSRLSDAVGFVVKWNETPRDVVREALKRLDPSRVRGVILNDVDLEQVAQYGETYEQYVVQSFGNPQSYRDMHLA